jgi:hypothetical protein
MTCHPQAAGTPGGLRLLLACGCQMGPVWECAVLKGELAAACSTGPARGCAGPGWVTVISTGPVGEYTPLQDPCWMPRPTQGHPQATSSSGGPRGSITCHPQAAGSTGGPGGPRQATRRQHVQQEGPGGHDMPPVGSGFTRRTNQSEVERQSGCTVERQSGSSQDKATRGRTGNSEHHEGAVA